MDHQEFQVVKDLIQADSWGCIRLASPIPRKSHSKLISKIEQILLDLVVSIPEPELWLWNNDETLSSVCRGMQQIAQGEVHNLSSFAEYADLEIED